MSNTLQNLIIVSYLKALMKAHKFSLVHVQCTHVGKQFTNCFNYIVTFCMDNEYTKYEPTFKCSSISFLSYLI